MLNPELEKVYSGIVLENIAKVAAYFEKEGRHAILCHPVTFQEMNFPYDIYCEGDIWEVAGMLQNIGFNSVDPNIAKKMEIPVPGALKMEYYEESEGGIPLWV